MDFLEDIKEETLLIVPNVLKEKVLKKINSLDRMLNVKIVSLNDLKKIIYFDYDNNAVLYLMSKFNYKYEVAKNYIDNMYFIEDKVYHSKKLKTLLELKKELEENKFLIHDNYFINYYKNKKVKVFGYDYLDKFNSKLLCNFNDVSIVKKKEYDKVNTFFEFDTLEEELIFVINKIVELINRGVPLNKIYLTGVSSEYNNEIIKLFNMYNIPIDLSNSTNLLTISMVKDAIDILKVELSFDVTLEKLREKYDLKDENVLKIYYKLVAIFNNYNVLDYSFDKIIEALEYEVRNTLINKDKYDSSIAISSLKDNYFYDDEYVFVIGANQGNIPFIYKDEEFISDNLKNEVDIESTSLINDIEKKSVLRGISAIKNLVITYKLHHMDDEFYPSSLLGLDGFCKGDCTSDSLLTNSETYSKIKLAEMLDDLIKYGIKNPLLELYFSTFEISYMKYNNKFSGIFPSSLKQFIGNKLVLSYSNIDTFYKCNFRFYLDNILKLNKYEENFNTLIGSLFHYVLSQLYKENFDLDTAYNYYLKDRVFSSKEQFFLNKLKKELIIICDRIKEFNQMTGLTNVFTEKVISIEKSKEINVIFKGIVDKIMYKNFHGKTLVSVIDYKTGFTDIDIYNSVYGIGMQLIIYLYLISKSGLFSDYEFVGFYLQRILSGEVNIEKDKSYIDIKNNNLKLYGYSTTDTELLEKFDLTYENSEFIMSMKYGKNGFYRYSKVISKEEMDSLIDLVDRKIDYARDTIIEADFAINPKRLSDDKEVTGCKYCHYRDICFRKNEDIVILNRYNNLSFLSEEVI